MKILLLTASLCAVLFGAVDPLDTNFKQIGGADVSTGNGVAGTGTQRVSVSSDNTPFSVNAIQSGTWNINNIAGTISLPTGAATELTLAKLTQTQGSTTSGQSGPLIQGAVTTGNPSYTTGQTAPLSLTLGGLLRSEVQGNVGSGSTDAGSPVKIGGVFNTTQPTIVSGSRVDTQHTTRGAVIIATGVETPAFNLAQVNGVTVNAGAGNSSTGTQRIVPAGISSGAATTVSVTSTSTQLLAANANRRAFIVTNVGGNSCYIGLGFTPTTTSYSFQLNTTFPNDTRQYDIPFTGVINAIRPSGSTNVVITELQ